jgi:hypothetical protein
MKSNSYPLLTTSDILAILSKAVALSGSQAKWCDAQGISTAYVSDVLNGRREPGKKILDALGYEAVAVYRAKT